MVMPPGISRSSEPYGPFTVMWVPTMLTSTPAGTVIGACPIRDMSGSLPDVTEDFAADLALTRFPVGHEPLAGGQDSDTQATEHARYIGGAAVNPQPGGSKCGGDP